VVHKPEVGDRQPVDRKRKLGRLVVGDIFHAMARNGAIYICLIEAVTGDKIEARRVTTQEHVAFDRSTGAILGDEAPCTIDSIAPLPVHIHNVMLGLDRKMRLQSDPEKYKLNKEEIQAIAFVNEYYPSNPL
jgi:hypothetical protein